MVSKPLITILLLATSVKAVNIDLQVRNPALNSQFYEEQLDPELCAEQLQHIASDTMLRLRFLDSGLRFPRGILTGNTRDFGNYRQCLGINQEVNSLSIEGKFCMIDIPVAESPSVIPGWTEFEETIEFERKRELSKVLNGKVGAGDVGALGDLEFSLAVCIPKPCTTQEGLSGLLFNGTGLDFGYDDDFCRLQNDKPWAPADYVAIVIFSIIGLVTLLSTCYDLWHAVVKGTDSKSVRTIYKTFSIYTNARRLTTCTSNSDSLECVDGIRALAMVWVILGHSYSTLPPVANMLEVIDFMVYPGSLLITVAPITVDTFFMISGMLIVYTTAGKFNGVKLLKNLHLFYLNRYLRMFPLLAAAVLLQASVFNRIADGPNWNTVASHTNTCRTNWWLTLLHVQNLFDPENICVSHSWYLAIDMQLHILCPVVLFWVLGRSRKAAWVALTAALMAFIVGSTVFNFLMNFKGATIVPSRFGDSSYYGVYYYHNTLTRASPYFVGMIFGYLLHIWRGKKLVIPVVVTLLLWVGAISLALAALLVTLPMKAMDYENQLLDNFVNSYQRPVWAMSLGWIVFACVHGYGGPVNWFLSLRIWKLPSRISYGMYIFHYPLMFIVTSTTLIPVQFTSAYAMYMFVGYFALSFVISFVLTLLIDSPFSTIVKLVLGGGQKPAREEVSEEKL